MDLNRAYRLMVLSVARCRVVRDLVLNRGRAFSRRFVAGDAVEDAFRAVDALERSGVHAILDLLGEQVTSPEMARRFKGEIVRLIDALGARPYPRYVSLKLTQLGLNLDEGLAAALMEEILQAARRADCFARIDMEDSHRVDATLRVYRRLRAAGFRNTGIVLQSYLRRAERDLEELLPLRPALRIVKGAYDEPPEVAFQARRAIDANFLRLARMAMEAGLPVALATHDPRLIGEMKGWIAERGIDRGSYEFQMLYGIRRDEQKRLAAEGHTVRAYVPYGTEWYPYLSRRIAERPENLLFVARSILRG